MKSRRLSRLRAALLPLPLLALAACESANSPISPSSEPLSLESIATSATAVTVPGQIRLGAPPSPSGGPAISVSGNETVVNGGTMVATITALAEFDTIFVLVGARTLGLTGEAAGGIEGYYEIRLSTPTTSSPVLLTFPQSIPLDQFELLFAVASPSGAVGPFTSLPTRVIAVGSGDVQITLSWDTNSDVDLHVVEPGGEEIFYGHKRSATGGELDLDSNAACQLDGVRNENITWPIGRAPRGTYTVRVDYWSNCGVSRTNFTVRINSGTVQIFDGSFTGSGDQGGPGSGRFIATFDRATGPAPTALRDPSSFSQLLQKSAIAPPR
jgi:hypothetical protein